jgi:subtilisin family serine protease
MYKKRLTFFFFAVSAQFIMSKSFSKTLELKKVLRKNNKLKFRTVSKLKGTVLYLDENAHVPKNWHQLDYSIKSLLGISSKKAYLAYPQISFGKEIVVAVIDAGIDVNHEDLKGNIWVNYQEIPNNNIDDDSNGYVDDYMGWNFLGSSQGHAQIEVDPTSIGPKLIQGSPKFQLKEDSLEITREYNRLLTKNESINKLTIRDTLSLKKLERLITSKRRRAKKLFDDYDLDLKVFDRAIQVLAAYELNPKRVPLEILNRITPVNDLEIQAINTLKDFSKQGIDKMYLKEQKELYRVQYEIHYNHKFSKRAELIKDNPNIIIETGYGNNDVIGPDPIHGTHIAGIIAANRQNDLGMKGIAENVKIMAIRAIPDGDERDKDIVNSIYYAVNNGAHIINLSFGKYLSPNQAEVQTALKYAKENNVLVVQAAGNDYLDIDKKVSYPNPKVDGKRLNNYITVAASSPDKDETAISSFSNYGKVSVDITAPGTYIYSTTPNNKYASMSGTSMAAPVVSAIAAVLLSQDSTLTSSELKTLIISGRTDLNGISVFKPGIGRIQVEEIIKTPGVVNLYNSLEILLNEKTLADN